MFLDVSELFVIMAMVLALMMESPRRNSHLQWYISSTNTTIDRILNHGACLICTNYECSLKKNYN
jgi:hypothetical protein